MTITVNGVSVTQDFSLGAAKRILKSITPDSASPILPQLLVIEFNNGYDPANMEIDEFTVGLVSRPRDGLVRPNGDLTRYLNVVAFDKVANTITVKYGGAYSGEYKVSVTSKL